MIEQIMYFLLGVLIATLFALLILPAVWHRAVRLTTRRVEAAVPVSLFEVQADKDQQQAAFAMSQRRLELQMDEMREAYARQSHAVEENRLAAFEANQSLAALAEAHDALRTYSDERDTTLAATQQALAETSARLDQSETDLAARTAELEALTEAHTALSTRAEQLAADLGAAEASNAERADLIQSLETKLRDESGLLADTSARLDGTRAELQAAHDHTARLSGDLGRAEAALAAQAARHDVLEQSHTATEADLLRERDAAERARTDLDASRAVLHAFEQSRAKEFTQSDAEIRRLGETLAMLRADHAMMEEALRAARAGEPAPAPAARAISLEPANDRHGASQRERAVLKQALGEMAAEIVALAARQEGEGSAVPDLVAAGGLNGTATNGHGHGTASEIDLAGRIRALLEDTADGPAALEQGADHPHVPAEAASVNPDHAGMHGDAGTAEHLPPDDGLPAPDGIAATEPYPETPAREAARAAG